MISEIRRRAYLGAMQVTSWMPRVALPFAAPSRPALLAESGQPESVAEPGQPESVAEPAAVIRPSVRAVAPSEPGVPVRPRPELPRPGVSAPPVAAQTQAQPVLQAAPAEPVVSAPPPRFSLQLLRAGRCLLLVELPTGEPFQGRDPAYLLLRDLLRAAGLPDSPQQVGDGEPIRWPLLSRSALGMGPADARDYVQAVLAREREGAACIWLIGLRAIRFGGERDEDAYCQAFAIEEVGAAWALPGLELLMDEPQRKAELWQSMRRQMPRWSSEA